MNNFIFNSEEAGRAIRASLDGLRVKVDAVTVERLRCFAYGYLAHAEDDEDFSDQCYFFNGFDIFFNNSDDGLVSVSAYASSVEFGTCWDYEIKLFSTRKVNNV